MRETGTGLTVIQENKTPVSDRDREQAFSLVVAIEKSRVDYFFFFFVVAFFLGAAFLTAAFFFGAAFFLVATMRTSLENVLR